MNIRRYNFLIAAATYLFFTGCKKEKTETYYVKAIIDGQTWAADSINVLKSPLPDAYPVLCRATFNDTEIMFAIPPPTMSQEILFEGNI